MNCLRLQPEVLVLLLRLEPKSKKFPILAALAKVLRNKSHTIFLNQEDSTTSEPHAEAGGFSFRTFMSIHLIGHQRRVITAAMRVCASCLLIIIPLLSVTTTPGRSYKSFAMSSSGSASCPDGTRAEAEACVLDQDIQLGSPLELSSFTTLNCRGHRILPQSPGTGTTPVNYVPSVPAVAIAITGDREVDVRNCVIGSQSARFDFGIIAINSKVVGKSGHRVHDNEIHARDSGIVLLRVDDARVNDNTVTWMNGFGIVLMRDSDRNRISGNRVSSTDSPPGTFRLTPDGPFQTTVDNGIAVNALHLDPLINFIVGGRLYQFPNSEDGQYARAENNIVEDNSVYIPGSSLGRSHIGILVAHNAVGTMVGRNSIDHAGTGVRLAGLREDQMVQRAARCSERRDRFCHTGADCFIPGVDDVAVGACPLLATDVLDLRAQDSVVENNILFGPFNATQPPMRTAIFGGNGTRRGVIRGNRVFGTGVESGITLVGESLDSAEVTDNVVQGAAFGLVLQQVPQVTSFGAKVFRNDFVGSTIRAIDILGAYTLPTELSWLGVGNYWGNSTAPCFTTADTPSSLIQDNNASCVPFAINQSGNP